MGDEWKARAIDGVAVAERGGIRWRERKRLFCEIAIVRAEERAILECSMARHEGRRYEPAVAGILGNNFDGGIDEGEEGEK